ncbi:hypothetical protein CHX26_08885 [Porphyrobacter sp. HT-58-2]|nr:hypothetical protein CHX26_08885 [Porphyrobacter sp. HT-58-2]
MNSITISQLSPAARRALAHRALSNGRKPNEEACAILEEILCPPGRLLVGSALSELSRQSGLSNADVDALEAARLADPAPPVWFG